MTSVAASGGSRLLHVLALVAVIAVPAGAQTVTLRGFADAGSTTFTASRSFAAILGSASGPVFGGGIEAVLSNGLFAGVRISRFRRTGERVVIVGDERFGLGIDTTITVMPLELTAGYRFGSTRSRLVPYAGGGVGWHRFTETSAFADPAENITQTSAGLHVAGGVELRASRWVGVAAEGGWSTVRNALGRDPNGVSAAFEETDLGGATIRVKVVVGR